MWFDYFPLDDEIVCENKLCPIFRTAVCCRSWGGGGGEEEVAKNKLNQDLRQWQKNNLNRRERGVKHQFDSKIWSMMPD